MPPINSSPTLIYLSPLPWSSFAQRPHKFVEWFHERTGGRVVWIDPYPTRLPRLIDVKRLIGGKSNRISEKETPDWLELLIPKALPIEPLRVLRKLNSWMWQPEIQRLKLIADNEACIVVVGKPSALALDVISALTTVKTVFDCMDDFPAFYTGTSKRSMRAIERQLASSVDEVWASGRALVDKLQSLNSNLKYIPNGLDPKSYPEVVEALRIATGHPFVLGYVGTIASWFDWEWVIHLAHQRPHDEIRLIGPVFSTPPSNLPANLCIKPACSHKQAIEHMTHMTIGLIPFLRNELTSSVDPIKYYEYRAMGLPVISTAFGDMAGRENESGCFISHGLNDLAKTVEQALSFNQSPESLPRFRAENAWSSRFESTAIL